MAGKVKRDGATLDFETQLWAARDKTVRQEIFPYWTKSRVLLDPRLTLRNTRDRIHQNCIPNCQQGKG